MGLASSLSTALTGMNAAETQIDVLGNNLANSQTVGFKSSDVVFANQFLQTLSLGAAPTGGNGGTNPRQTGLGVQVAAINQNFKQGTVEISSSPSDLAIQGDGFFQVQGGQGEKLYTRNGIFRLNSSNELVTSTGNRLLGYGVDDQFNLRSTELVPLSIPIGTEAVAKATGTVNLQGTLTAKGDVATTSKIVQSTVLGNNSIPRPSGSAVNVQSAAAPFNTSVTLAHTEGGGGTHAEGSVYQYRFTYLDANGTESMASEPLTVTVPGGNASADNTITLNNLPAANSQYSQVRVYRTEPGGSDFFLAGTAAAGGSFVDTDSSSSTTPLDNNGLTGNYTYMVTYYKSGEPESRPSPLLGPQSVVNGRIYLSNLPTPPAPPAEGGYPAYDEIRIYRNLTNDPNSFYLVDTVPPGASYTDSKTDAEISNLALPGNQKVNLDGPAIDSNTLLVNVITRDGLDYSNPFIPGDLSFTARKGDRLLETKSFTVTATSTVQDLLGFMKDSLGIVSDSGDSTNPILSSLNQIPGEGGTIQPNAYISNGALRFVSNTGVDNGVTIDLTSFRLRDANGTVTTPNLGFGTVQEGKGQSAVTDFIAYDSLGLPVRMRLTATMESRTDQQTVYRWYADSADNIERGSADISVGTGLIYFDGNGNFISASNNVVAVDRTGLPSTKPLQFSLDFTALSGLAADKASLAASRQDGSPPGVLTSYVIGEDGIIRGVFSNGISRDLGQIRLARFSNPGGLEQRGQNLFAQGINTGLPIEGGPSENGLGSISAGALELSNTDVGGDLVTLVLASTQYRSNARVITATQQLFDELLNIRR
ncbi:Flagellar hook protein FlgE [Pirellula sp. SH-Sr6A]|uniref:flagellar hook-basal body complex protein n=1 Tax=Pirellula sp. SH-Sr6A TaxID=1632865 RepID=UPI00078DB81F|nr:flagellar hook-basal body complex protein [Pirellula sp. SH-Sr6A]AMV35506.1 Flagellar hook protein FlgE [Pirellula sp. SH-Sr6A]